MLNKSSNKKACENYLFEDYRSKSSIRSWILALAITGRTRHHTWQCLYSQIL